MSANADRHRFNGFLLPSLLTDFADVHKPVRTEVEDTASCRIRDRSVRCLVGGGGYINYALGITLPFATPVMQTCLDRLSLVVARP